MEIKNLNSNHLDPFSFLPSFFFFFSTSPLSLLSFLDFLAILSYASKIADSSTSNSAIISNKDLLSFTIS